MLWVLEGYDGTGKTTLAKKIAEKHNAKYIHFDASISKDKKAFNIFKNIIEEAKHKDIVCDRFFYGQFVYQEDKDRVLTLNELNWLEQALDNGYTTLILCETPVKDIQYTQYLRGEEIEDFYEIENKVKKFRDLMPYWHKVYNKGDNNDIF